MRAAKNKCWAQHNRRTKHSLSIFQNSMKPHKGSNPTCVKYCWTVKDSGMSASGADSSRVSGVQDVFLVIRGSLHV